MQTCFFFSPPGNSFRLILPPPHSFSDYSAPLSSAVHVSHTDSPTLVSVFHALIISGVVIILMYNSGRRSFSSISSVVSDPDCDSNPPKRIAIMSPPRNSHPSPPSIPPVILSVKNREKGFFLTFDSKKSNNLSTSWNPLLGKLSVPRLNQVGIISSTRTTRSKKIVSLSLLVCLIWRCHAVKPAPRPNLKV